MNPNATTRTHNNLEACLLAVLHWHEQGLSVASLRARVGSSGALDDEMLAEAADSLGYDVSPWQWRGSAPALPDLPAIGHTRGGGALALLDQNPDGTVLVVDPTRSDKPHAMPVAEVLAALSGRGVSLSRRVLPPVAGNEAEVQTGMGRHGHWFWGPLLRTRWVYVQVALAALLVNVFAIASSVFSMIVYDRVIPNNAWMPACKPGAAAPARWPAR
jgi:ATP-binding cassette subfamily C protein LapB